MEDDDSYIGKQIGNYLLIRKLGGGTFGSVYLAQHRHLNRSMVAIKILNHSRLSTNKEQETFFEEAKFLDILKHRYILPILDVGIQEDLPYLITEYAPNGSLDERIRGQRPARLPMRDVLLTLSQIGQALQYAHRHTVVHRDLKPANILFNDKWEALIADFGIALQLKEGTEDTKGIRGTLAYMAPEQFENKVSIKSDQYALACIAYELFTGTVPLVAPPKANLLGWAHTVRSEKPVPPRQLNPDLSDQIEEAILKALEKDRANRHSDIVTFITSIMSPTQIVDISDLSTSLLDEKSLEKLYKIHTEPGMTIEQWLAEGDKLHRNSQLEEALVAYEQAIQLGHKDAATYYIKGTILLKLKKLEEALVAYEKAILFGHDDAMAYYYKGYILHSLNNLEEALVAYEQAIQLDPIRGNFHSSKGNVLRELKHYADALKAYNEAIRLSPDTPIFHINRGDALFALRDFDGALESYNQAIQVAPNNVITAKANVGKAHTLLRLRRYNEAIKAYERATELDPKVASASLYLAEGDAFWRGGHNKEALKAYERGIELDPENVILQQKRDAMLDLLKKMKINSKHSP
jgi:serine/threonine protein kinase/Tfp pilus assembly protein PilF